MNQTLDNAINKVAMCLREAHTHLMPSVLDNLQKSMLEEKDELALAKLSLISADVARTCNLHPAAVKLVERILNKPPSGAMPLLSAAKRLRVSLYLDAGQIAPAMALADSIDALEIESSAFLRHGESMVVMSRNEESIEVETWLTLAEIYCSVRDSEKTLSCLQSALKRLFRDEEKISRTSMTITERAAAKHRIGDCRDRIEFWDTMARLIVGDQQARELFGGLQTTVAVKLNHDKRLIARINAVLGEWLVDKKIAPLGICLPEAARLFALGLPSSDESANAPSEVAEIIPVRSHSADESVIGDETVGIVAATVAEQPSLTETFINSQIEATREISNLVQTYRQMMERGLPLPASDGESVNRSRSLAGGLDRIILPGLLELALGNDLTGYFQVTWEPNDLESSIKAGLIDAAAGCGRGYLFLQKQFIVDATLGSYDVPIDKQDCAEEANVAIEIMMQISMATGLDTTPKGDVFFQHSPSVALRPSRVMINNGQVVDFFRRIDEKLYQRGGLPEDSAEIDDFEADWGCPSVPQEMPEPAAVEPQLELLPPMKRIAPVPVFEDDNLLTF